jgi:hypothetical protein
VAAVYGHQEKDPDSGYCQLHRPLLEEPVEQSKAAVSVKDSAAIFMRPPTTN